MDFKQFGKGLLFLLLGLVFVGGGVYLSAEETAAMEAGEAIEAEIVSSTVVKEGSNGSNTRRGRRDTTYYPDITYRYEYDGRTYESSNVLPGSGRISKGQQWAEDTVVDYPAGALVTAYMNPDAPEEAFLIKESSRFMHWLLIGAGGFVVLLGLSQVGKSVFR